MQAMEHSSLFKEDTTGKAIVEQVTPIVKNQEMLRQFCVAICTTLDRDSKAESDDMRKTVAGIIDPIRQELTRVRNGLSACAANVRKLPVANKEENSTFRVTGVTGISAAEAHTKWTQKRQQIAKSWKIMKTSQNSRADILEKLTDPDTSEDQKTELRNTAKDCLQLADVKQAQLYGFYADDGEAIVKDSSNYKNFTVPKSLDEGNYEKFLTAYQNWRNSPATIKEYYLILYDLDYIFDAVDAVQSMHLDPPDRSESFMDEHDTSVTGIKS